MEKVKEVLQKETKLKTAPEEILGDALFYASQKCPDPKVIEALVNLGAHIDGSENHLYLHVASSQNNPQVVEALVRLGAKIDLRNYADRTPLMHSTENADPKVAETLIKLGADVDAKDHDGLTALALAAGSNQNPKFIELLAAHGADVNVIESCQLKGNFISRTLDSGFRRNDEQGSYRHIGESRYPEWPLFLLQDSISWSGDGHH